MTVSATAFRSRLSGRGFRMDLHPLWPARQQHP
jgi:hypothetical protein